MDILDAIIKRKSIRGYKPDPVPKAIIRKILEIACRAPSTMNSQPWEFVVLAGKALREICEEISKKLNDRRSSAAGTPRSWMDKRQHLSSTTGGPCQAYLPSHEHPPGRHGKTGCVEGTWLPLLRSPRRHRHIRRQDHCLKRDRCWIWAP